MPVNSSRFIFFGTPSRDELSGLSLAGPATIIAYHHHMEDEYEVVGADIFQVFVADEKKYQELT
jgi:hypothetical protein